MSLLQASKFVHTSRKRRSTLASPSIVGKTAKCIHPDQVAAISAKNKVSEEQIERAIRSSMSLSSCATRVKSVSVTVRHLVNMFRMRAGILRFVDCEKIANIQKAMKSNLEIVNQVPWGAFLPDACDDSLLDDKNGDIGHHSLALFEGNHRLQSILNNDDEALKEKALSMKVCLNVRFVPQDIFDKILFSGYSVNTDWNKQSETVKTILDDVLPYLREAHIHETIQLEDSFFEDNEEFPLISSFVRQAYSKVKNAPIHVSRGHIDYFVSTMISMKALPDNAKMAANLSFCPKALDDMLFRLMKAKNIVLSYNHCWFNVVKLAKYDLKEALLCITAALDSNYEKEQFADLFRLKAKIAKEKYTIAMTPSEVLEKKRNAAERQRKKRAAKKPKEGNLDVPSVDASTPAPSVLETPKSRGTSRKIQFAIGCDEGDAVPVHNDSTDQYEFTDRCVDTGNEDFVGNDGELTNDHHSLDEDDSIVQKFYVNLNCSDETVQMAEHVNGKVVRFYKNDINSLQQNCENVQSNFRLLMNGAWGYILPLDSMSANAAKYSMYMKNLLSKWPSFIGFINNEMCVCGTARNEGFLTNLDKSERCEILASASPIMLAFNPSPRDDSSES